MGDLFHPAVPFEFIDKMMDIINICRQHTFLILTKRQKRMDSYIKRIGEFRIHSNVHLGVSISTQAEADEKIPILLQIPVVVRWLSVEPLLENVNLLNCDGVMAFGGIYGAYVNWIVVGCESGPQKRPCDPEWIRSIVQQCKAANVPVFVKQINVNGKVVKMPKDFPQEYP